MHPQGSEKVVRAWLEVISPGVELPSELVSDLSLNWRPVRLKEVFTSVLSLGKATGRLGEAMVLLGHQEAAFRQLRDEIGIPRAAPLDVLPRAAVVFESKGTWWSPGGWIPDILDRAAGRDVLRASGDPNAPLDQAQLVSAEPEHVFVLAESGVGVQGPECLEGMATRIHRIDLPERWLIPGPRLPFSIFEAASCLHGVSSVFSPTPDH
ncbi:MAG: hypothetical protein ACPGQT_10615 [Rhodothermales bacterium]